MDPTHPLTGPRNTQIPRWALRLPLIHSSPLPYPQKPRLLEVTLGVTSFPHVYTFSFQFFKQNSTIILSPNNHKAQGAFANVIHPW